MHISKTLSQWQERRRELTGLSIGFVPTMGALHEGHASLVRRCRAENDVVVASIFVNPKQFAPGEDFHRYPRPFEADRARLAALGVDAIFHPPVEQIYPPAFRTAIDPGPLERCSKAPPARAIPPPY